MAPDWHEWHQGYDEPTSPLSSRLAIVQGFLRDAIDGAPPGPVQVVSMCAGQGRDILGVLEDHPRRRDVGGRLVELDPGLVDQARDRAPATIEVVCGDAGVTSMYEDAVPADIVIVCGVFGNINEADMDATLRALPMFCAPGATVVWTRHRRPPDKTVDIRATLGATGFDEIGFVTAEGQVFGVGAHRFTGTPEPLRSHVRLFDFVGYDQLVDACPQCGFSYEMERSEVLPWLRSDIAAFIARFSAFSDEFARRRPEPDVWSPLEYACHVRDVLVIQRERIRQAQVEDDPAFTPMRRDERAVEQHYNEQDPEIVATEIQRAGDALVATLEELDDDGWSRRGVYNFPTPQLRTVEWIAIHTVHELMHHRMDIGTFA
jgi:hypothetical protein